MNSRVGLETRLMTRRGANIRMMQDPHSLRFSFRAPKKPYLAVLIIHIDRVDFRSIICELITFS